MLSTSQWPPHPPPSHSLHPFPQFSCSFLKGGARDSISDSASQPMLNSFSLFSLLAISMWEILRSLCLRSRLKMGTTTSTSTSDFFSSLGWCAGGFSLMDGPWEFTMKSLWVDTRSRWVSALWMLRFQFTIGSQLCEYWLIDIESLSLNWSLEDPISLFRSRLENLFSQVLVLQPQMRELRAGMSMGGLVLLFLVDRLVLVCLEETEIASKVSALRVFLAARVKVFECLLAKPLKLLIFTPVNGDSVSCFTVGVALGTAQLLILILLLTFVEKSSSSLSNSSSSKIYPILDFFDFFDNFYRCEDLSLESSSKPSIISLARCASRRCLVSRS